MKTTRLVQSSLALILAIGLFSCVKKNNSSTNPGFSNELGTGGNPNPHPTATGTPTSTNPATQNSSIYIGGSGWSNPSCATTNSLSLQAKNGTIDISITFAVIPTVSGSYAVAATPATNQYCSVVVNNAPNQPSGTVWYGKSGVVSVNVTTTGISATFAGIICTQQTFTYPQVSLSGQMGCN